MTDPAVTDGGSAGSHTGRGSTDEIADRGPADDGPGGAPASDDADAATRGAVDRPPEGGDDAPPAFLPAYGSIAAAVGYVLFYLLVDRATPVLVDELAAPFPDVVPEPFTTYAAMVLWLFLGGLLLTTVRGQLADNPRTFADADERETFLDEQRRPRWRYRIDGALVVVGGAATVLTWDGFVTVLVDLLSVVVVELEGATPVLPGAEEVAVFVVFFVGVAALARGLDRLLIGGVRELLSRRYRE